MESGATITQISTEFMQKTKNRPILWLPHHSWVDIQKSVSQYSREMPV
jgi:hypothetical protein